MLSLHPQTDRRYFPSTCLIIEDNDFDRERLCRVVRKSRSDIQILQVVDLRGAREALERGGISLILLDNNLPDGLGADFAVELSKDPHLSTIPVIMISDWPSPFMWQKAASAGVAYVLSKSEFDGRYLRATLDATAKLRIN